MVFSSLLFLFRFLPAVLVVYYLVVLITGLVTRYRRKRSPWLPADSLEQYAAKTTWIRNLVLFAASLIFYAWGEPVYVVLMLFSTVVDYTHGMLCHHFCEQGKRKQAKAVVASSMIINLLLLGVFKYSDFLLLNINSLLGTEIPLPQLALPIGISFYTFQTMSYTVDIYRGQAKVQRNILSFGAYVALFPQLIAGPIVQYKTIAEELSSRTESSEQFSSGVMRFMCGLFKKVLLANNIGLLWDLAKGLADSERSVLMAWLGITAYAFQIYFDFSGYSDMAIGLGKMFGFHFPENFRYPYQATSITDFWRRWHISLGSWFREYVYIPLGGNRGGFAKTMRNIAIVWLLTGIWHGAAWNFLLWGVFYGVLLIIEKLFLYKLLEKLPAFFRHVYALLFIWLGWVIFAIEDLPALGGYFSSMFGLAGNSLCDSRFLYSLLNYGILLIVLIVACTEFPAKLVTRLFALKDSITGQAAVSVRSTNSSHQQCSASVNLTSDSSMPPSGTEERRQKIKTVIFTVCAVAYTVIGFVVSVAYLVDDSYNPFLYLRF